jgi:hypothetical protein
MMGREREREAGLLRGRIQCKEILIVERGRRVKEGSQFHV